MCALCICDDEIFIKAIINAIITRHNFIIRLICVCSCGGFRPKFCLFCSMAVMNFEWVCGHWKTARMDLWSFGVVSRIPAHYSYRKNTGWWALTELAMPCSRPRKHIANGLSATQAQIRMHVFVCEHDYRKHWPLNRQRWWFVWLRRSYWYSMCSM